MRQPFKLYWSYYLLLQRTKTKTFKCWGKQNLEISCIITSYLLFLSDMSQAIVWTTTSRTDLQFIVGNPSVYLTNDSLWFPVRVNTANNGIFLNAIAIDYANSAAFASDPTAGQIQRLHYDLADNLTFSLAAPLAAAPCSYQVNCLLTLLVRWLIFLSVNRVENGITMECFAVFAL